MLVNPNEKRLALVVKLEPAAVSPERRSRMIQSCEPLSLAWPFSGVSFFPRVLTQHQKVFQSHFRGAPAPGKCAGIENLPRAESQVIPVSLVAATCLWDADAIIALHQGSEQDREGVERVASL